MKNFKVEQIYCKTIKNIEGYDLFDALKKAQLNYKLWKEVK